MSQVAYTLARMHRFNAAWWLRSPHLQTVWGRLSRKRKAVALRRETLPTPDDDELLLDHLDFDSPLRVVLLHGLEGSSNSVYMQGILELLRQRRIAATALNFRACARSEDDVFTSLANRGSRLYHSGETSDLDHVLRMLRRRAPEQQLAVFGASLGGNVVLKWLGENSGTDLVVRAATLSVPYDLAAGARHLEGRVGRLYVRSFLRSLSAKAAAAVARHPQLGSVVDLPRGKAARSFYEFDDAVTAPLHGFAGADDYYSRSSSIHFLDRITVPTLCVSAEDDPFLPRAVLQKVRAIASPAVKLVVTRYGGHVGFIAGRSPFKPRYWGEELVVRWLVDGSSGEESSSES